PRPRPLPWLRPGVTLVEMMVAVGITILMMMATSVVFKSAGAAAGKANSSSEIMQQARALCRQLENDFRGLRPDMPMAVIFEEEGYDTDGDGTNDTFFRKDRIVFFANGDFQTTGGDSGNLARIFYGQARDDFNTPQHLDNPNAPWRRVLARRYKILTPSTWLPVNSGTFANWMTVVNSAEEYDDILLESSNESYWKTEDPLNFANYHFRTSDGVAEWDFSMVRRPDILKIQDNLTPDALQQLYMLPDVSDFRIDMWYEGNTAWGVTQPPMSSYWNMEDMPKTGGLPFSATLIDSFMWFSEDDFRAFPNVPNNIDLWPKALRFTFTLYDRDRRYFPDGKAFTYIVKLPKRI
ncbi:MAG: hypothetical protein KAJ52_01805, partial [Sedimentisphaerales bacterium]|nr:hypothetical protein [Sedimentisphaerales bacterium]